MEEKKKRAIWNFIKAFLFLLLLGWMLYGILRILDWKDTTGDYLSSMEQLYHTPDHAIDVAFLGSSHCYCSIYPAYLWQDEGIAAFDVAVSGQDKASTCHALMETLKTQKPKVVFVELYGLFFDRHAVEGNVYRNMLSMKPSLNSLELIREYVEPEKQMDFVLRWPIVHTRFWEVDKYDFVQYEPSVYGRGADYQWHVQTAMPGAKNPGDAEELEEENVRWLERLVKLCREEEMSLVFFVAPFPITEQEQRQLNAAKEFAGEHGVAVLDFNEMRYEIGLADETDFVDDFHCNAYGAKKVTDYVRDYLMENYQLEDHRRDVKYALWDQDLKWYRHLEAQAFLNEAASPEEYLRQLSEMEDVISVISIGEGITEESARPLECLGLSADAILEGDKYVLQNGKLHKLMGNEGTEEFCMDLSEYDALRVRSSQPAETSDVQINYESCLDLGQAVNVIPYDLFLKERLKPLAY